MEQLPARWVLNVYPGAGEAGGCFVPSLVRRSVGVKGVLLLIRGVPLRRRAVVRVGWCGGIARITG